MTTTTNIFEALAQITTVAELDAITAAIAQRRKTLVRSQLSAGARVRLTGQLRPKRLVGMTGTVVDINQTTATVKLDSPDQRYGTSPRVPMVCLEPLA